jgi:hypothetical protein
MFKMTGSFIFFWGWSGTESTGYWLMCRIYTENKTEISPYEQHSLNSNRILKAIGGGI